MRLVEVEIENYKQYAGAHVFRPGEKSMVAIVGQNGAGKTTLFEAIEWCLYNPNHIKNDSLTPRVAGGKPRVRVVLEDAGSGMVYEIERSLKGGSTKAEIYRLDQPESPLVQGTRQVTEYVTRELTGLPHAAFVSTFFTKQKELSFFGDMGPTERREQVGRLLGLETIRVAQRSIGDQRTRKQSEARVKREQYEEQSKGIDFPAERAQLDEVIARQETELEAARASVENSKQQTATATANRDVAQQRYAANAELLQSLERVNGDITRFEEMRSIAQRDLAAIAEAELEIERQQTQATGEPALREQLQRHETEKQKGETSARLATERDRLSNDRRAIESVYATNAMSAGTIATATALISTFDAELVRIGAIDLDGLRLRRDAATQLGALEEQRNLAAAKLESMQTLAADLARQVEELTSGGLPADRLKSTQDERADLLHTATAAVSVAAQTEKRAKQLRTLEQNLRDNAFDELCPTCARPFRAGEAEETLRALSEQVAILEADALAERNIAEQKNRQAADLVAIETQYAGDAERYQHLTGRLENGRTVIDAQEREVATLELELGLRLRESQRHEVPDRQEIARLVDDVIKAEAESARRPRLEMDRERLLASIQQQGEIEEQITALGVIAYDAEAHRRDHAAWALARDAVARIEELRKQVAQRPDREATVTNSTARLEELTSQRQALELSRSQLAFDATEVSVANAAAAEALACERAATEAAHAAETSVTAAKRARGDLDAHEARLQALNQEAIAAQSAHAELTRVYTEFARFEQYVALVVTPHMSEIASDLLSSVTDGKYDRMEFTEDYGIEVYDGEEDRFPLSQYSGGERDVIALCARLALSQVIGGQATTPIQFMVLDEVFGSLDIDRRRNLMEMLQRLMEENQAFRQLFVISHVDDVRAGAMFDEVWRVAESGDGVSQLEQVSVTGALEDY